MTQTIRPGLRQEQRRWFRPWLMWTLAVFVVVIWWVLYQSRWFLIEQVKVDGVKRLSVEQVLEKASVRIGQPLMAANPGAIHKRLTELPVIQQARVERSWPNTLLIHIVERQPIAVVPTNGKYVWVDEFGHIAGYSTSKPKNKIVVRAKPESQAIVTALKVYLAVPDKWRPLSLKATTQDDVQVQFHHNVWVVFGSAENVERKVRVAGVLLTKGCKLINVSSPDTPTVRYCN